MIQDIQEAKKFDEWMRKIKNVYYHDNNKMLAAYKRVQPLKMTPCL